MPLNYPANSEGETQRRNEILKEKNSDSELQRRFVAAFLEAREVTMQLKRLTHDANELSIPAFLNELSMYLENNGETDSMLLKKTLLKFNVTEEDKQRLFDILRNQVGIIYDIIDSVGMNLEPGERSEQEVHQLATINQEIAQFYFRINSLPFSDYERKAGRLLYELADAMQKASPGDKAAILLTQALSGARAQAGICNALEQDGYTVILPNHENSQEITDWDLKGVDFIAVKNGRYILIDSKGLFVSEGVEKTTLTVQPLPKKASSVVVFDQAVDFVIANKIQNGYPPQGQDAIWSRLEITIPTGLDFIDETGIFSDQLKEKLRLAVERNNARA